MADVSELRGVEAEELDRRLNETKEELFRLRMQHATLQLTDTSRLRQVRREIAQIMTVQRERRLAVPTGQETGS